MNKECGFVIELISIIVCVFTKKQLKKEQGVDLKTLEVINSVALICLIFLRTISVMLMNPNLCILFVTIILAFVYAHNIKELHRLGDNIVNNYCNNCGTPIKSTDLFCKECGHTNESYKEA